MKIPHKTMSIFVVLISIFSLQSSFMHAMNPQDREMNNDQSSIQEDQSHYIPIHPDIIELAANSTANNAHQGDDGLFVKNFLGLFEAFEFNESESKFGQLSDNQKTVLLHQFLRMVNALRCGTHSQFLNREFLNHAECVLHLLSEENELLQEIDKLYGSVVAKERAHGLILACKNKYVENASMMCYLEKLDCILEDKSLGNEIVKEIFIEALNRCNQGFKELDADVKKGLFVRGLKLKWYETCGHPVTNWEEFWMALSLADEPGFENFCFHSALGLELVIALCCGIVASMFTMLIGSEISSFDVAGVVFLTILFLEVTGNAMRYYGNKQQF